ncbi:MAG TPA: hypothetical protein VID27_04235 [Blastocatellia bacterium]
MNSSEREIARNLLTAALSRLDGSQPEASSSMLIIVLNESNQNQSSSITSVATPRAEVLRDVHPSLLRLDLPKAVCSDSAPKACLIEPDRHCVGSGACETLGH